MEIMLKRTLRGLEPTDETALAYLRRVKQGDVVLCEVRRPRSLAQHRKFRALLNLVWAATGNWDSVEDLHNEIKFRTGWVTRQRVVDHRTGEVIGEIVVPRSTSFDGMDQDEFNQYMESAIRVVCEELMPGVDDSMLREEILNAVA